MSSCRLFKKEHVDKALLATKIIEAQKDFTKLTAKKIHEISELGVENNTAEALAEIYEEIIKAAKAGRYRVRIEIPKQINELEIETDLTEKGFRIMRSTVIKDKLDIWWTAKNEEPQKTKEK